MGERFKGRKWRLGALMLCLVLAWHVAVLPVFTPAYADEPTEWAPPSETPPVDDITDLKQCSNNSGYTEQQVTSRIVFCIKAVVYNVVLVMLADLSDYMRGTTIAAFAVAVAVFGIRLVGGETEIKPKSVGLMFRLGLVYMFSYNLGNLTFWIFGTLDWMITLVVPFPGWTPWEHVDAFMGRLLGFAPGLNLAHGVAGVIFASALSATTGSSMFGAAAMSLWDLMTFVLDIVYAYLTALLVIGFMIIVSPFFVPMALFPYTERYFKKWLNQIMAAMLMPVLLFAFLSMSLGVFDNLIQSCISNLSDNMEDANNNPTYEMHWRINQPMLS
ncbi:MAG: type IV secretion system protein, partial [Rickettsiales bacterium]|nr:type IV secretion system protein [Rickettsiales bacterium]